MGDSHRGRQPGGSAHLRHNRAAGTLLALTLLYAHSHAQDTRDDLGRQVSLPQAAQRIVTLSPHATELVLAAGAGRRLAGVAAGSRLPAGLEALPRIGAHAGIDREALLALSPDLVVAWQSGNRATDLGWIVATGTALYRSEPASMRDIARTLRDIGILSGTALTAERAALAFEQALQTPCRQLPPQPAYVLVWDRPAMTVGGRHWINSVLQAAGYRNVLAHLDRGVFAIAPEAAFAYSPLTQISLNRSFDHGETDRLADLLSRPGPRLGEAVQLLCARRLDQSTLDEH